MRRKGRHPPPHPPTLGKPAEGDGRLGGSFILRANAEGAAECITYSISVCTNQG